MGELGLLGIPFPEEYGGSGGDTVSYALAVEEIGRACGGTGLSYRNNFIRCFSNLLFRYRRTKQKYLVPMASGKTLGAFGLTEPNAGSDAGGTQTKAVLDGDEYVISGEKCWITNAEYANTIIVTAVNGVEENGRKRISAFIVPTTSEGLTISSPYDKMGVRASNTCEIVLDGVRVPKENILGDVNKGFKQFYIHLMEDVFQSRLAVGIAQSAFERALQYAKERQQFGKSISNFQAIQFKLADMATEVELARNLVHKALWLKITINLSVKKRQWQNYLHRKRQAVLRIKQYRFMVDMAICVNMKLNDIFVMRNY